MNTNVKITQIKNMIYKYIFEENTDVYLKFQTLFEFMIKDFIRISFVGIINYEEENTIDLIYRFASDYERLNIVIKLLKRINRKSNAGIKHYNDLIISFDEKLIKETVVEINKFNNFLFPNSIQKYSLDEKIFDKLNVNIQTSYVPRGNKHVEVVSQIKKEFFGIHQSESNKPQINKKEILINSGTSNNDFGFTIKGIQQKTFCEFEYESIYAIIFNFLQRNSKIEKDSIIREYENKEKIIVDYKKVYRLEMAVLLLIKNNYFNDDEILINSFENYNNELKCAIYHISEHFNMIAQLIKMNIKQIDFVISEDKYATSISLNSDSNPDIAIKDMEERISTERHLWFAPNLKYEIHEEDHHDNKILTQYLGDFFKYENFKPGQLKSIIKILNENENQIIIMPTGSGKSLIYYFVGFLQPSPSIIVTPTDTLIKDQLRNLIDLHGIDDCDGYFSNKNVINLVLQDKFVFITPEALQNRSIIKNLIDYNVNNKISNIFLDEIHTISNWSHSFNPNYLMLSFNLLTFLDSSKYIGFTATANYRVIKDILEQLKMNFDNVLTPIDLKNDNAKFKFSSCTNETEFINHFNTFANSIVQDKANKAIVFTKNKEDNLFISNSINEKLRYEIDVFTEQDENSYLGFVKGRRSILISESDMGVGINIPEVNKIMHYGIPISKAKYVQEIGRAGRTGSNFESVVLYKNKANMTNKELKLLDFNSSIDEILDIISIDDSDVSKAFRNIVGHLDHYSIVSSRIYNLYSKILPNKFSLDSHKIIELENKTKEEKTKNEIYLYFLVKMGIIFNWYILETNENNTKYDVEISENLSLNNVKETTIEYISIFGDSKETIYKIEQHDTVKNIIYELQDWYFNQFLLYHREQLLNTLDFFDINGANNESNENIINQLSDYFSISSTDAELSAFEYINEIKLKQKIVYLNENNSYVSLVEDIILSDNDTIKLQMEAYMETKYDVNADLYIFLYNLFKMDSLNVSRFKRIYGSFEEEQIQDYNKVIPRIHNQVKSVEGKMDLIKVYIDRMEEKEVYDIIYSTCAKDVLYYHHTIREINNLLRR